MFASGRPDVHLSTRNPRATLIVVVVIVIIFAAFHLRPLYILSDFSTLGHPFFHPSPRITPPRIHLYSLRSECLQNRLALGLDIENHRVAVNSLLLPTQFKIEIPVHK
jgi:hypothetical protein